MSEERTWKACSAENWARNLDAIEAVVAALGRRFMARVAVAPGERILDIGCGGGVTSRELAARVGPEGRVLGVDISAPVLERARARGGDPPRLSYLEGDAQTMDFGAAAFDLAVSRFGVMFFGDPPAAFKNIGRALAADGRLQFVCWQAAERNPWFLGPMQLVAAEVAEPQEMPKSGGGGPFSMADPARVTGLLGTAGFRDVAVAPLDGLMHLGPDPKGALDFAMTAGPPREMFAAATPQERDRAKTSLIDLFRRHQTAEGIAMPCNAWVVTARREG